MQLGNFSLSLAVSDIAQSRQFYEKLGFAVIHGDEADRWLILQNDGVKIGLFQGMFEKNMLTFNPGWDANAQPLPGFTDVREIQRQLRAAGIEFVQEADESTEGPAHLVVIDPDGNPIMLDQHV